jgi:NADH:ubiquinone oxidoreductase subunit C
VTQRTNLRRQLRVRTKNLVAQRDRRFTIQIPPNELKPVTRRLLALEGYSHLSTITAVDTEQGIETIYHHICKDAIISLKILADKEKPKLPTIVDLVPGAALYEREVHDLFGVKFVGNPDLSRLLLPDRWPEKLHPLLKSWTTEKISNRLKHVQ